MNKILYIFISRGFVVIASLVIQILFWIGLFSLFSDYSALIISLLGLLSLICVIYIIIQDIYTEHKIAWLIFLVIFPIAGGIFYVIFGRKKVNKKTKKLHNDILKQIEISNEIVPKISYEDKLVENHLFRQIRYLSSNANSKPYLNTFVKYLKIGEENFECLVEELKKAKKFIFLEYFIIEKGIMWDTIEKILIEKANENVDVRVLFDDLGCILTLPPDFIKNLNKKGIKCHSFNKLNTITNSNFNNRDHRKICVIDGNVGFTGGINLADEYINEKVKHGHWKDTGVMLKGEAVYSLTLMFLSMWSLETKTIENYLNYKTDYKETTDGIVQPYGDNPLDNNPVGETVYMNILNSAKDYVYITTPYLIISREMSISLKNAAKSGVDVRIVLPGIPDKKFVYFLSRSYYAPLIKAGVKIYEYTPGFVHSKMFLSDDETGVVGTINLDYRSLDLHYECGVIMYKSSCLKDIKEDFLDMFNKSEEVTLKTLKSKYRLNLFNFFFLGILRTFSPLF
ncbi:MAG: cardiolipin synthase [Mycoplasmatota bacterium]